MTAILSPTPPTHYEVVVPAGIEPTNFALVEVRAGTWRAEFRRLDATPGQVTGDWWLLNDAGVPVKRMSWADATFADGLPVHVSRFFPIEDAA